MVRIVIVMVVVLVVVIVAITIVSPPVSQSGSACTQSKQGDKA
jgi:flagellar basal body-associated protein FliL